MKDKHRDDIQTDKVIDRGAPLLKITLFANRQGKNDDIFPSSTRTVNQYCKQTLQTNIILQQFTKITYIMIIYNYFAENNI